MAFQILRDEIMRVEIIMVRITVFANSHEYLLIL